MRIKGDLDTTNNMYSSTYDAGQERLSNSGNKGNMNYSALGQAGMALAQNIGNIYDLNRSKDIETRKFEKITPNLLNPSEDLRMVDRTYNAGAKAIRSASGGDATTYLQNMRSNSLNKVLASTRIKQQYENANAGIRNSIAQYNANAGDRETIANAQIRANQRNIKSSAISNIGQNVMGQYRDYNATQQEMTYLQTLAKTNPQGAKVLEEYFKSRK